MAVSAGSLHADDLTSTDLPPTDQPADPPTAPRDRGAHRTDNAHHFAADRLGFAAGVMHRISKRGLVIGTGHSEILLFEHPLADQLPDLLASRPTPDQLAARLGSPPQPGLVNDLIAAGILTADPDISTPAPAQRIRLTRTGISVAGIDRPARWVDRHVVPVLTSRLGKVLLAATLATGMYSLARSAPHVPPSTGNPATAALLLVGLGMLTSIAHEFAHAVALVHFGRTPRLAGLGFYWGCLSFYVDSAPAFTLPRSQRVIQALAGLATDLVTTSVLAILAHSPIGALAAITCWRRAVLNALAILVNAAPILELDGHWALADYLDEPDLAARARGALAASLHRRSAEPRLAGYGAVSVFAGLALIGTSLLITWHILKDLLTALFTGDLGDILIGAYLIGPVLIATAISTIGLLTQATTDPVSNRTR
jgi:putative peptide zinc metalloprotease protein